MLERFEEKEEEPHEAVAIAVKAKSVEDVNLGFEDNVKQLTAWDNPRIIQGQASEMQSAQFMWYMQFVLRSKVSILARVLLGRGLTLQIGRGKKDKNSVYPYRRTGSDSHCVAIPIRAKEALSA